ncbi:calcium and integrin-binding family member 2-like [Corticium candelabrum]|uniref:calcium and integrin-binding family member 2-like n=1 Tax=Corticium candelabrum TaxID=121492 RepID=UPI002E2738E2|nr:calcium and integrin-binding family member 2-like [Corticium candelabrum]
MGASWSCRSGDDELTREKLDAYQNCTYFTHGEIKRVFDKFKQIAPVEERHLKGKIMHQRVVNEMSELKYNPFNERICKVFSSEGNDYLTFDDFLDMMSVFSEAAPRDLKATYAFRIYDFNNDNMLDFDDLHKTLECLTGDKLEPAERTRVIQKVLKEADLDSDDKISFVEFEHVISRAPDFANTFHIRLI